MRDCVPAWVGTSLLDYPQCWVGKDNAVGSSSRRTVSVFDHSKKPVFWLPLIKGQLENSLKEKEKTPSSR
jgi:hypothetical protein